MSDRVRKRAVPSRRRPETEAEEEEQSVNNDAEEVSASEGSITSNDEDDADVQGSEASLEEKDTQTTDNAQQSTTHAQIKAHDTLEPTLKTGTETEAMLNGLGQETPASPVQEVQFDGLDEQSTADATAEGGDSDAVAPPQATAPKFKTHQQYIKERDTNPAFVPNRGGFFLHDDRTMPNNTFGSRGYGRGRGLNRTLPLRNPGPRHPSERAWAHDLHETHRPPSEDRSSFMQNKPTTASRFPIQHSQASNSVNRSLSTSVVQGSVAVRILLPGMSQAKTVSNVAKKQHTLLPQHRPPLRRDKPVRISIPDEMPRYIFPSIERSFIFIPRAMRPNQHAGGRGRGRGSYQGSRRTSLLGGSVYSPSGAMSRKSSIGMASRDDTQTPASIPAEQAPSPANSSRPVVRMPVPPAIPPYDMFATPGGPSFAPHQQPAFSSHINSIPIHQPRPKKTVSVADIESPVSHLTHTPQQQQDHPFHQQVPSDMAAYRTPEDPAILYSGSRRHSRAGMSSSTPLSQIPERAIYAQPFQPYPIYPQQAYFPLQYPNGAAFHPMLNAQAAMYNGAMASTLMAPSFYPAGVVSTHTTVPQMPSNTDAQSAQTANAVAHESNGMVYYYDPNQMSESAPNGFTMPPAGMMAAPPAFYYPPANGMFYPSQ